MKASIYRQTSRALRRHFPFGFELAVTGLLLCSFSACNQQAPPPKTDYPPPAADSTPTPVSTALAPPPPNPIDGAGSSNAASGGAAPPPPPPPPAAALPMPPPLPSPTASESAAATAPAVASAPHWHLSAPQLKLHGPENKDVSLLLSLDLSTEQLQSYYDSHFKPAEAPVVERQGELAGYQVRYTHLRASIDCGDGHVITCKAMEGYPRDIDATPGVMAWRWNVVGVDDGQSTATRSQAVRIVVLGASDANGTYERLDSLPDIPLQVSVEPLTRIERLLAAWTHLADSIKALLVAVIAAIGVLTGWLRSTFKKGRPPPT